MIWPGIYTAIYLWIGIELLGVAMRKARRKLEDNADMIEADIRGDTCLRIAQGIVVVTWPYVALYWTISYLKRLGSA